MYDWNGLCNCEVKMLPVIDIAGFNKIFFFISIEHLDCLALAEFQATFHLAFGFPEATSKNIDRQVARILF